MSRFPVSRFVISLTLLFLGVDECAAQTPPKSPASWTANAEPGRIASTRPERLKQLAEEQMATPVPVEPTKPDAPKWTGNIAILVCPAYVAPIHPLPGVRADCQRMESVFRRLGYTPIVLADNEAVAKNVLNLLGGGQSIRHLVVFYSGHGVTLRNGRSYLVTSGVTPSELEKGLWIDDLILAAEKAAQSIVLIFDACRTEFLPPAESKSLELVSTGFSHVRPKSLGGGPGTVAWLYGSEDGKPSYELPNGRGGVLTTAIGDVVDSLPDGKDIKFEEVSEAVIEKVSRYRGPRDERQTPVLVGNGSLLMGRVWGAPVKPKVVLEIMPGVANNSEFACYERPDLRIRLQRMDVSPNQLLLYRAASAKAGESERELELAGHFISGADGFYEGEYTPKDPVGEGGAREARTEARSKSYSGRKANLRLTGAKIELTYQRDIRETGGGASGGDASPNIEKREISSKKPKTAPVKTAEAVETTPDNAKITCFPQQFMLRAAGAGSRP